MLLSERCDYHLRSKLDDHEANIIVSEFKGNIYVKTMLFLFFFD